MTGFAQAKGEVVSRVDGSGTSNLSASSSGNGRLAFALSLK